MVVRQDVAVLGPGWNKTLLNYALAIRALDELPLSDRNSWRFFGAIHGFDRDLWVSRGIISADEPVPAELTDDTTFGNQCQHASWYFPPWHRGYLWAFEAVVAAKVKELTGDDWAVPYWNYLDPANPHARDLPTAFTDETLPGETTPNPLKYYRGGQLRQPNAIQPRPTDTFSLKAMEENDFTVDKVGFGGGISDDFAQFAEWTGGLESNPHNIVHVLMGRGGGLIGDPFTAGLDPLFWLHHCNIDRLWEAWMRTPGKAMVKDPRWLNGPGNRRFLMPALGNNPPLEFSGQDTLGGGKFHPTYDDLTKGTGVTPGAATIVAQVGMGPANLQTVEVIGANAAVLDVGSSPQATQVALDLGATQASVAAMGATEPGEKVARLYLALEGVRGDVPSALLDVFINLPAGTAPQDHAENHAASVALFGLNAASDQNGPHGGNGLNYTIDITDLANQLAQTGGFDAGHLTVTVQVSEVHSGEPAITIDRISVLKRTGVVT